MDTRFNLFAGLARTIHIRCNYDNLGREITKYTVISGVCIHGSGQFYLFALFHQCP